MSIGYFWSQFVIYSKFIDDFVKEVYVLNKTNKLSKHPISKNLPKLLKSLKLTKFCEFLNFSQISKIDLIKLKRGTDGGQKMTIKAYLWWLHFWGLC